MGNSTNLNAPGKKVGRDAVQQMIVRQSSLKIALEHLSMIGENINNLKYEAELTAKQVKDPKVLTKENVIALAEYYTDYVFTGL